MLKNLTSSHSSPRIFCTHTWREIWFHKVSFEEANKVQKFFGNFCFSEIKFETWTWTRDRVPANVYLLATLPALTQVARLKRCWLCSVNPPRIGKQVQFAINANIPQQAAAEIASDSRSCMHISPLQIHPITYFYAFQFHSALVLHTFSLNTLQN